MEEIFTMFLFNKKDSSSEIKKVVEQVGSSNVVGHVLSLGCGTYAGVVVKKFASFDDYVKVRNSVLGDLIMTFSDTWYDIMGRLVNTKLASTYGMEKCQKTQ